MDINIEITKFVPDRSDKVRIHFIRNLKNPDWYIVKVYSDRGAYDLIVRCLHLPPYEQSGFKDINLEWAFAIECEAVKKDRYCNFLKYQVGTYVLDEDESINSFIRGNGWYEFKDITNTDKWLADYYALEQTLQQKSKLSAPPVQGSLF